MSGHQLAATNRVEAWGRVIQNQDGLVGCTALAKNKYTTRHNAALKILFFEILQDLGLVDSVQRWYSPLKPKPLYESNNAQAFWDVPLFAEHQEVRANRVDARIINHVSKRVVTLEMSCLWVTNREKKKEEKNHETRTASLGIKAEVPRIRSETI